VIAAHLLPQIWLFDQLGAVILGLIIGMQAASGRRARNGTDSTPPLLVG
jgi:hypothetical protein